MRTLPWVRQDLISQISANLWRYLTPAATIEAEVLQAAALLQMSTEELRVLGRIQFLISAEVGSLLDQLPFLIRRLATTTASEEEWSAERIRGPIQWGRTIGVRQATGIPHLYVTAPARRAYQTPENELLVAVLDAVIALGRRTGWHHSESVEVGRLISARVAQAQRWLQMRSLLEVERRPISATKLSRVRSGRYRIRYKAALNAYNRFRMLAERLDRESIRHAVETYGLVSRDDATLFELICTFRVIDSLRECGWMMDRLGLFEGSLRLIGKRADEKLVLTYQRAPTALTRVSAYRQILAVHGIPPAPLRPDISIEHIRPNGERRWLLVEAKGGKRAAADSARAALLDLLAYRTAFARAFRAEHLPYGLGIAWGAELAPSPSADVLLCTPDAIGESLAQFLG